MAFGVYADCQEPKAVLFDDLGKPNCELLWARLDGFASDLQKRVDTVGIIDIISAPSKPAHRLLLGRHDPRVFRSSKYSATPREYSPRSFSQ